jgi:hypothetical protein
MPLYLPIFALIFSALMDMLYGLDPALKTTLLLPVIALKPE